MSFGKAAITPLLAAAAPILLLAAHNAGQVSALQVLATMALALAFGAVVFSATALVCRDRLEASLVAGWLVLLFLTYGHVFDALEGEELVSTHARLHAVVAAVYAAAAAALTFVILRARRDLTQAAAAARLALTILSVMGTLQVAYGLAAPTAGARDPELEADKLRYPPAPRLAQEDAQHPDVYVIVLDGYARADVLRSLYGFDNSEFLEMLRGRGFYVAEQSRANYAMTFLSLASAFNLRYLDGLTQQLPPKSKDRNTFYRLLHDSLIARMMQARGYTYVHFNTNYAGTESSDRADVVFAARPPWLQSELAGAVMRTTALNFLAPSVADLHLYTLDNLPEVARDARPTFTVGHVLLPHNPYVFDRHGNVRSDVSTSLQWRQKTGGWGNRQGYLDQLQFLNDRVKVLVERILERSKNPPVILLISDHGSASSLTDTRDPEALVRFADERLPNLCAVLAPEPLRGQLYPEITLVNLFRLLASTYGGGAYERLPDRAMISWYKAPYRLIEVTPAAPPTPPAEP